jgi:hypothetical protein
MPSNIQVALQNCATRELEKLKKYDWNENSESNFGFLVSGCLMGIAAVSIVADAGGVANLPDYLALKVEHVQPVIGQFIDQYSNVIMGAGGSIVGAGAIMFLRALRDEHHELRARAEHAFNEVGHGMDYIRNVEEGYDCILDNHEAVKSQLKAESQWISKILGAPTPAQATILEPTGAINGPLENLLALKSAYLHGVKKYLVEGVLKRTVPPGKLSLPTQLMEVSILDGMLDYYVAADKQVPGILSKVHFVLTGDPEALKNYDRPAELASNAINAILELKGKQVVHSENSKRERLRGEEFGM